MIDLTKEICYGIIQEKFKQRGNFIMEKFENLKLDEVRFAEAINVDGKQVIKVIYYNDTYVNIPYNEDDLNLLQQQMNINKVTRNINNRIDERNKKAMADRQEMVAVPGTEKTYKETTGLNNEEYGKAVIDKTAADSKQKRNQMVGAMF